MRPPGERTPGISSHGRNVKLVEAAKSLTGTPREELKGKDGDVLYRPGRKQGSNLPAYSEALAQQEEAARKRIKVQAIEAERRAQRSLKDLRIGVGQVNTEQPITGGQVEPDERDVIPH